MLGWEHWKGLMVTFCYTHAIATNLQKQQSQAFPSTSFAVFTTLSLGFCLRPHFDNSLESLTGHRWGAQWRVGSDGHRGQQQCRGSPVERWIAGLQLMRIREPHTECKEIFTHSNAEVLGKGKKVRERKCNLEQSDFYLVPCISKQGSYSNPIYQTHGDGFHGRSRRKK